MSAAQVSEFIKQIAPLIITEGQKRGYKIFSTVIAQAIIESRYGQSTLATKAHNYFGLKAGTAWIIQGKPSIVLKTKEEYTVGKLTTIKDAFRSYPDMAAGVAGYYDFISTKRYANLREAVTYVQYAQYLKADGYATSSTYINTLTNTVKQYNLNAYDVGMIPVIAGEWIIGNTYTTQQDLNVRREPNGDLVPFTALTPDGQKHSFVGPSGTAILKRGTKVTVLDIKSTGVCTWLQIPSGWICGKNSKSIFVL